MPVESDADNLPYRAYEIPCPVCGNANSHERLSWDAYRINSVEEDEHPLEIIWKNKEFARTSPLQFFWAFCESCYFTAELDDKEFRTWVKNEAKYRSNILDGVFDAHIQEVQKPDGALATMGQDIDPAYPFESTLDKCFLGIYSECLKKEPSVRDLGRFYLRVAWMYRDRERFPSPTPRTDHEDLLKSIQESYALTVPTHPDLPAQPAIVFTEAHALKMAGAYYAFAYKVIKDIGIEGELKLLALIGEVNFRAYELDGEEPVFDSAKYYFNAGMKRSMQVLNDKEMDPANKNRARVMLDRIGTRGGELMKLHRARTGEPEPDTKPKKKKGILGGLFS